MEAISRQRCLHHPEREAVARCPECKQFFCRECVIEHDDRVICAECLKKMAAGPSRARARFAAAGRIVICLIGFFAAWLFFYEAGRLLLLIPTSFHDGTIWKHSDS
jgi:uncharacterized paraquat-inducible protein A